MCVKHWIIHAHLSKQTTNSFIARQKTVLRTKSTSTIDVRMCTLDLVCGAMQIPERASKRADSPSVQSQCQFSFRCAIFISCNKSVAYFFNNTPSNASRRHTTIQLLSDLASYLINTRTHVHINSAIEFHMYSNMFWSRFCWCCARRRTSSHCNDLPFHSTTNRTSALQSTGNNNNGSAIYGFALFSPFTQIKLIWLCTHNHACKKCEGKL